MPEFELEKKTGLPVFDCELLNKHKVKLAVKALIDTSRGPGMISYRIFSALGFDDEPSSQNDRDNNLEKKCRAWVLIDVPKMNQKKLEGVFEISKYSGSYDLVLGMDIISNYFDLQILPSKGIFLLNFFS
jgi:hypothetical protein